MSEFEDRINSVLSDPEQMDKITKLAQSLMADGGGEAKPQQKSSAEGLSSLLRGLGGGEDLGIDPAMIGRISRLVTGGEDKKQERALLEAMRPYMSEKRRSKMDRALKLARLAGIAKLAMGEMGGDGDDKSLSG